MCPEADSLFNRFSAEDLNKAVPPARGTRTCSRTRRASSPTTARASRPTTSTRTIRSSRTRAPYGGAAGALLWLFSSGGTVSEVTKAYVVGKEAALRDRMKSYSDAKGTVYEDAKLTPGEVLRLALELTDGDVNQATLLAHNALPAPSSGRATPRCSPPRR